MAAHRLMRIGEVAERTGLSLRTIRFYGEVGVVGAAERSEGGFRLYTEMEVRRLELVRRMRPLGFCLEDVRGLLDVLELLPETASSEPFSDRNAHEELVGRLRKYWQETDARCEDLRAELASAEAFARSLHGHLARLVDAAPERRPGADR
ncbi:MerR family transcriptional regulator [Streptomyces sp. WMMB 322]|uniref:MerR family transcriptional regulator n=1 Tax=Streptomyces sp. WMMB 322 TaxID=1286821 RepID=UPI0006E3E886|nr:MerR family transcriptional regulator [Streptomyces sp. WMMB 322]SCK15414.1 transcriptional regulator, MerR family [Streptomyces sp. WMMB 322]